MCYLGYADLLAARLACSCLSAVISAKHDKLAVRRSFRLNLKLVSGKVEVRENLANGAISNVLFESAFADVDTGFRALRQAAKVMNQHQITHLFVNDLWQSDFHVSCLFDVVPMLKWTERVYLRSELNVYVVDEEAFDVDALLTGFASLEVLDIGVVPANLNWNFLRHKHIRKARAFIADPSWDERGRYFRNEQAAERAILRYCFDNNGIDKNKPKVVELGFWIFPQYFIETLAKVNYLFSEYDTIVIHIDLADNMANADERNGGQAKTNTGDRKSVV